MTQTLDDKEMRERGYIDIVGNLPLKKIEREILHQVSMRNPEEIIIKYNLKQSKATFYILEKDFNKKLK